MRELRLDVPVMDGDLASDRLWGAGAQAIEEFKRGDRVELRTVLADDDDVSRSRIGAIPTDWRLEFDEVSGEAKQTWRQHSVPIVISPRLIVYPAWQMPPPTSGVIDELQIAIEPGAAFGLGDHPTTRLSAAALDRIELNGLRILDVGCGTGVLAILAACRGAVVTAVDISEAALVATLDNAARNRVEVHASTDPLSSIEETFDVIVANILAPTLIALAPDLKSRLADRGRLIISGVLANSHDHVIKALAPLNVQQTTVVDGWAAVDLVW